jgi:hypothetical protein
MSVPTPTTFALTVTIWGNVKMKLTIFFAVVIGAILVWWLRSVKPKRKI